MSAAFLLFLGLVTHQSLGLEPVKFLGFAYVPGHPPQINQQFPWQFPFNFSNMFGLRSSQTTRQQDTCMDCTQRQGRLWFTLAPSRDTRPCCTTSTTAAEWSGAPAGPFKCGAEGGRRIVGGTQSTAGKYPWTVAYQKDGESPGGCSGTLVAAEWVVTAAHCVEGFDATKDNLKMILGEFDLSSDRDSADTNRKVVPLAMDPIVHESYKSPFTSSNDIALLKLAEAVDLNIYTPACLPALNADYTGKTGRTYGWGTTASCPNTGIVSIMEEVAVPIVSDATCEAASSSSVTFSNQLGECQTVSASYSGLISADMLCAGAPGKDTCQGDSGGPLTVRNDINQHELVGVVSWGYGCAADGLFGVYSEVAKFRTWIDMKITANGGATFAPRRKNDPMA